MSEPNDTQVEQPKAGELPPPIDLVNELTMYADGGGVAISFGLTREEARFLAHACRQLLAEQQVSAGLREERNCPKCAGKGCYECKSSGSQVKRLLGINEELVNSHNSLLQDAANQQRRAEAAEASLAEARAENELYCTHALVTLSGAGFITPAETYGANTSWVIGDLCRAVTAQHAELATLKAQEAELADLAWHVQICDGTMARDEFIELVRVKCGGTKALPNEEIEKIGE